MFYEFGPFRIDSSDRQLWHQGSPVHLTPKAFELLVVLVESRGRLLKKQDLIERVWPGTFVEESNLAQNIATLRKALGDHSKDHPFILTVPKQGYRFVTPVVTDEWNGPSSDELRADSPKSLSRARVALLVLGLAVSVFLAWSLWKISWSERQPTKPQPITSMPGLEFHSSFSPDGSQIAFSWIEALGWNSQIYVCDVKGGRPPIRLVTSESVDAHPAWSPDGRLIAFIRIRSGNHEVHVVAPNGGVSRKVANTRGKVLAWWPDSLSIVLSDPDSADQPSSLIQVSLATGVKRKLTTPVEGIGDIGISISHDGVRLAVIRSSSAEGYQILVGDLATQTLRGVLTHSTPIFGVAWSPNDEDLIFSASRGNIPKLWRIAATPIPIPGKEPVGIENIEDAALFPATFRSQGSKIGRLAYSQMQHDMNIRRWNFAAENSSLEKPDTIEIAPSTRLDLDPAFSPDGERIVFASDRAGSMEIWVCRSDGSNSVKLTRFGHGMAGSPRWSADSKKIVFDYSNVGQNSIYSINEDGSGLLELSTGNYQAARPSWSVDSNSIYFQCAAPSGLQICKIPSSGGIPVQVTEKGGADAHESPDGRYVYFVKSVNQSGLWRVPVGGGNESFVIQEAWQGYWAIGSDSIYYIRMEHGGLAPSTLRSFHLQTGRTRDIVKIANSISQSTPGFSMTSNGRSMLLVQIDTQNSDLMLMENFR